MRGASIKNIIKVLSLMLTLLMLLSSCSQGPSSDTDSKSSDTDTVTNVESEDTGSTTDDTEDTDNPAVDPIEKVVLTIVEKGSSGFKIVYPHVDSSVAVPSYAKNLQTKIREMTGASIRIIDDAEVAADSDRKEILIGNTNRSESEYFASELGYLDYAVGAKGNKLVIIGASEEGNTKAVDYFVNKYVSKLPTESPKQNVLTFSSENNYQYSGFYPMKGTKLVGVELKEYTMVLPSNAGFVETRFAAMLNSYFKTMTGRGIKLVNDTEGAVAYEILVGNTNRSTSSVTDTHGYAVNVKNGKIEILASSLYGYEAMFSYIQTKGMSELRKATGDGEIKRENVAASMSGGTELVLGKTQGANLRIMYHNIWGWNESATNPTEQRNQMLLATYLAYSPDVLCLQECTAQMRNGNKHSIIKGLQANGYTESANNEDGGFLTATPILYKTDKFTLVDSGATKFTVGGGDDKFITWAVLSEKASGNKFAVFSVHLAYQQTAEGEAWRIQQVKQLVDEVNRVKKEYGCEAIVGGDMNSWVKDAPYKQFGTLGLKDIQGIAKVTEDMGTAYDYPTFNPDSGYMERTSIPSKNYANGALDHVFFSGSNMSFARFDVVMDNYALLASDHAPILIDFSIGSDYTLNY